MMDMSKRTDIQITKRIDDGGPLKFVNAERERKPRSDYKGKDGKPTQDKIFNGPDNGAVVVGPNEAKSRSVEAFTVGDDYVLKNEKDLETINKIGELIASEKLNKYFVDETGYGSVNNVIKSFEIELKPGSETKS